MYKVEVNKIAKQDVDESVLNEVEVQHTDNRIDLEPAKIRNVIYKGRNYNLDYVNADTILVEGETNLKQMKDLPKTAPEYRFVTTDTVQNIGKILFERVQVTDTCNVMRKKDLTIENIKPVVQAVFDTYFSNNIYYLPIDAYYISDEHPGGVLRGYWEYVQDYDASKLWKRVG